MRLPESKYWNTWNDSSFGGMKFIPAGFSIIPAGEIRAGVPEGEIGEMTFFETDPADQLLEHEKDGKYVRLNLVRGQAVICMEYLKHDDFTLACRIKVLEAPEGYVFHGAMGFESEAAFIEKEPCLGDCSFKGGIGGYFMHAIFRDDPSEVLTRHSKIICSYKVSRGSRIDFAVAFSESSHAEASSRARRAILNFDEAMKLRTTITRTGPTLISQRFGSALDRVSDIRSWSDAYNRNYNIAYTSSYRLDHQAPIGLTKYFADMSFQIMLSTICGDRYMAFSTLEFMLAIINGDIPLEEAGLPEAGWGDSPYPPVLAYCMLTSYYMTGDVELLERSFPVLYNANRWCPVNADSVNSLQCIDTEALAIIAGILGKNSAADELRKKSELLNGYYEDKLREKRDAGDDMDKTIWDYLWLRRCGRDEDAWKLVLAVDGFYSEKTDERTELPGYMLLLEHFSIDPWNGVSFGTYKHEDEFVLRDFYTAFGKTGVVSDETGTSLYINGKLLFKSNFKGRFSNFVCTDTYKAVDIDNKTLQDGVISFMQDDRPSLGLSVGKGRYRIEITRDGSGTSFDVVPLA